MKRIRIGLYSKQTGAESRRRVRKLKGRRMCLKRMGDGGKKKKGRRRRMRRWARDGKRRSVDGQARARKLDLLEQQRPTGRRSDGSGSGSGSGSDSG